jgi:DNA-binding LacI/PurR family transcriptional regulator
MSIIPKRVSLLAQSVESLRLGIASGQWEGHLPPERALCEELEISRSTLRRAMLKIEEEGLIDAGRSGKRRNIISRPSVGSLKSGGNSTQKIIWLTRNPLQEVPRVNFRLIALLQSKLAHHDCLLRVVRVPEKAIASPEKYMAEWLDEQSADVWILHLMPEDVQQWFSKHRPVTCVFGSRASDIDLASVGIDSQAAIRHAIAMLKRKGHQRIGLVRNEQNLVGENLLEQIMCESSADVDQQPTIIRCPVEKSMLPAQFERVFNQTSASHPTALVCSIPGLAMFALTWLQRTGISVPGDVSIVLLRSQPLLNFASPSIAHYEANESRAVTQIIPRLLDLLQSQACETSHIGLISEFVAGESLGDAS